MLRQHRSGRGTPHTVIVREELAASYYKELMLLQHRHTLDLPLLWWTPQHRKLKPDKGKQKVITYSGVLFAYSRLNIFTLVNKNPFVHNGTQFPAPHCKLTVFVILG